MPHMSVVARTKSRLVLIFCFKIVILQKVVWEAACILDLALGGLGFYVSLQEFLAMSPLNSHHTEGLKYTVVCVSDHQNCLLVFFFEMEESPKTVAWGPAANTMMSTTQAKLESCSKYGTQIEWLLK